MQDGRCLRSPSRNSSKQRAIREIGAHRESQEGKMVTGGHPCITHVSYIHGKHIERAKSEASDPWEDVILG